MKYLALVFLCGCWNFNGYHFHATPDRHTSSADGGESVAADSGFVDESPVGTVKADGGTVKPSPSVDAGRALISDAGDDSGTFDASVNDAAVAPSDAGHDAALAVCYTPGTCVPFWTPGCMCGAGCSFKQGACRP